MFNKLINYYENHYVLVFHFEILKNSEKISVQKGRYFVSFEVRMMLII